MQIPPLHHPEDSTLPLSGGHPAARPVSGHLKAGLLQTQTEDHLCVKPFSERALRDGSTRVLIMTCLLSRSECWAGTYICLSCVVRFNLQDKSSKRKLAQCEQWWLSGESPWLVCKRLQVPGWLREERLEGGLGLDHEVVGSSSVVVSMEEKTSRQVSFMAACQSLG